MTKKDFKDNPALRFISEAKPTATKPPIPKSREALEAELPEGYKINGAYIEKKTKRVQLVLQPSLVQRAKEAAKDGGLSLTEFIARAIEAALTNEKGDHE